MIALSGLLIAPVAQAETLYVSDELKIAMKDWHDVKPRFSLATIPGRIRSAVLKKDKKDIR